MASKAGKLKKDYKLSMMPESTMEKIRNLSGSRIEAVFSDPTYGKVTLSINVFFLKMYLDFRNIA